MHTMAAEQAVTLTVDLDGTLCRTDTLHEGLLALVTSNPRALLILPFWLSNGRSNLKAKVADHGLLDACSLPLNEVVVELLRAARREGRRTILVSASDHRQVTAVARATGLFDEAFGSTEGQNLSGQVKADFLTQRFGDFDYIGNSKVDLPVWAAARRAITIQAGDRLKKAAEAVNPNISHLSPPESKAPAILKALRPHQWLKNILLLLPCLAAHEFTSVLPVFFAIFAFSVTASAAYIINDLIDLPSDRSHPRKRERPFASGALSSQTGFYVTIGLLVVSFILSQAIDEPTFSLVLVSYFIVTLLYSFWLKRRLIIDILTLAGLYTVRIIAGATAASVWLSPWLLGFSMFLFLALAAIKRQSELIDLVKSGRGMTGRAYVVEDLPFILSLAISSSTATIVVLALYISSEEVQGLYNHPEILWLICPILFYWTIRMAMKAHRGAMTDDPIVFAASDSLSVVLIALGFLVFLAAAMM